MAHGKFLPRRLARWFLTQRRSDNLEASAGFQSPDRRSLNAQRRTYPERSRASPKWPQRRIILRGLIKNLIDVAAPFDPKTSEVEYVRN